MSSCLSIAPNPDDLHSLLFSPFLARSLILIATHVHLSIVNKGPTITPAVRVLRLSAPLAIEDSGALRLVSLLERAERVARVWRDHPNTQPRQGTNVENDVLYLTECEPGGEFTLHDLDPIPPSAPPSPTKSATTYEGGTDLDRYPSPTASSASSASASTHSHHQSPPQRPTSAPSGASPFSLSLSALTSGNSTSGSRFRLSSSIGSASTASSASSLRSSSPSPSTRSFSSFLSSNSGSASEGGSRRGNSRMVRKRKSCRPPSTHRAFDAIVNFLPSHIAEKVLLKHAILVTTLGSPFLADPQQGDGQNPVNRKHMTNDGDAKESKSGKRRSLFSLGMKSRERLDAAIPIDSPQDAKTGRPHVVHILPSTFSLDCPIVPPVSPNSPYSTSEASSSRYLRPPVLTISSGSPRRKSRSGKSTKLRPKPKLVQSMEQFLLGFGYPLASLSGSGPNSLSVPTERMPNSSNGDGLAQRPVPFLLPSNVWGVSPDPFNTSTPRTHSSLLPLPSVTGESSASIVPSLGVLILGGVLDSLARGLRGSNDAGGGGIWPRAWIGTCDDVKICGDLGVMKSMDGDLGMASQASNGKARDRTRISGLPTPPESSSSAESEEEDSAKETSDTRDRSLDFEDDSTSRTPSGKAMRRQTYREDMQTAEDNRMSATSTVTGRRRTISLPLPLGQPMPPRPDVSMQPPQKKLGLGSRLRKMGNHGRGDESSSRKVEKQEGHGMKRLKRWLGM